MGTEGLGGRYREARDPVGRSRRRVARSLSRGEPTRGAMGATGYGRNWVRGAARRYGDGGPEALGDRRRENPGGAARAPLGEAGKAGLGGALSGDAPDGGAWTGREAAGWMGERPGRRTRGRTPGGGRRPQEAEWLLMPRADAGSYGAALRELAGAVGAGRGGASGWPSW